MPSQYFITMDTHCRTSDVCVKTARGKLVRRQHLPTTIVHLRELIESVPRPRFVAFEEGPLAGWLYRELQEYADQTIVCDPRRNAHIAKDGDKDDPIDAGKLNDLFRGGYVKAVHQLDSEQKAAAKQVVGAYHQRVRRRVSEGNGLVALVRRWGVSLCRSSLEVAGRRGELEQQLKSAGAPGQVLSLLADRWDAYEMLAGQEQRLHAEVCRIAHEDVMARRIMALPGYGEVRAATLVSFLDTPFRFKSRCALWKYVGIGLKRQKSGEGKEVLCVEQSVSRVLRNVVIGAAQSAIDQKENVFARRGRQWMRQGLSRLNARRNVAREQVTAIWGMWKSNREFDASLVHDPGD